MALPSTYDSIVIVCFAACLITYGLLLISAGGREGLWRLWELISAKSVFSNTVNEQALIQTSRKMVAERRFQGITYALPFATFLWVCCILIGLVSTIVGAPRANTFYHDMFFCFAFASNVIATSCLARGQPTRRSSEIIMTCWYVIHWGVLMGGVLVADPSRVNVTFHRGAYIVPRLAINLLYLRGGVASCFTIIHCVCQIVVYWQRDIDTMDVDVFRSEEMYMTGGMVVLTLLWDRLVYRQIHAEIENASTLSEGKASRRLLNTICDATFELDDNLSIAGEAMQLACMLQHGVDRRLQGTMIEQLVLREDRERFKERITAPVPTDQEMANVFRVRFCDSLSNVIDVEVFHVPLLRPLAGARHLVGLRESVDWGDTFDSESSVSTTSSRRSQSSRRTSRRSSRQSPRGLLAIQRPEPSASTTASMADPAGGGGFEPLVVKFDADTLGIREASGFGAEVCIKGSCFADLLKPGQDFFMDLEVGREALRDMLLTDPAARFQYHSSVVFSAKGPTRKSLCKVTLLVEGAAERAPGPPGCSEAPPVAATLQTVRALPPRPAAPPA